MSFSISIELDVLGPELLFEWRKVFVYDPGNVNKIIQVNLLTQNHLIPGDTELMVPNEGTKYVVKSTLVSPVALAETEGSERGLFCFEIADANYSPVCVKYLASPEQAEELFGVDMGRDALQIPMKDEEEEEEEEEEEVKQIGVPGRRAWTREEELVLIEVVKECVAENLAGEPLWDHAHLRCNRRGVNRPLTGMKNRWARGLRRETGIDERRKKNKHKLLTAVQTKGQKRNPNAPKKGRYKGRGKHPKRKSIFDKDENEQPANEAEDDKTIEVDNDGNGNYDEDDNDDYDNDDPMDADYGI